MKTARRFSILPMLLVSALLTSCHRPTPTADTNITGEGDRQAYGLPGDAEIRRLYLASGEKPEVCSLTPLNTKIYSSILGSAEVILEPVKYREVQAFESAGWAEHTIGGPVAHYVEVHPKNEAEKYVLNNHFCLGEYVPSGTVKADEPEVEDGTITGFKAVLQASKHRKEGVPVEFEKLDMFGGQRDLTLSFRLIDGQWEVTKMTVDGY